MLMGGGPPPGGKAPTPKPSGKVAPAPKPSGPPGRPISGSSTPAGPPAPGPKPSPAPKPAAAGGPSPVSGAAGAPAPQAKPAPAAKPAAKQPAPAAKPSAKPSAYGQPGSHRGPSASSVATYDSTVDDDDRRRGGNNAVEGARYAILMMQKLGRNRLTQIFLRKWHSWTRKRRVQKRVAYFLNREDRNLCRRRAFQRWILFTVLRATKKNLPVNLSGSARLQAKANAPTAPLYDPYAAPNDSSSLEGYQHSTQIRQPHRAPPLPSHQPMVVVPTTAPQPIVQPQQQTALPPPSVTRVVYHHNNTNAVPQHTADPQQAELERLRDEYERAQQRTQQLESQLAHQQHSVHAGHHQARADPYRHYYHHQQQQVQPMHPQQNTTVTTYRYGATTPPSPTSPSSGNPHGGSVGYAPPSPIAAPSSPYRQRHYVTTTDPHTGNSTTEIHVDVGNDVVSQIY